ncbi:MAG: TlpA disulfide reductase family protein [Candidatus Hydrogenedentota bacterium]
MQFVSIALFAALVAASEENAGPPFTIGKTISIELRDFDGNVLSLDDERFNDKVVLIDIWATWCTPCWVALPFIVQMQDKYRDAGLEVVSIAFEEGDTPEARSVKVRQAIAKKGINYPVLDGGGNDIENIFAVVPTIRKDFNTPALILLGRDEKVVYSKSGFSPTEKEDIEAEIKKAVKHD